MQDCMVGNWSQLVRQLMSGGHTQAQIAAALGVDQATVSRIANGQIAGVRFEVGAKLIELAGGSVTWPPQREERDAA